MNTLRRCIALGIVGLCLSFGVGCGDGAPDDLTGIPEDHVPAGSKSASTIAGADAVIEAVEAADYRKAVQTLAKMKRRAKGQDQVQYMILSREVKDMLLQLPDDPKANEALAALRMMSSGR